VLQRYTIPLPPASSSLLAAHAHAVYTENIALFKSLGCTHRSEAFNSIILPQAQAAIEAIGHALAYAAAVDAGVPKPVLQVYHAAVVRQDSAWYVENGLSRVQQRIEEDKAIKAFMPHLVEYLESLGVENYVNAPIVSERAWKAYVPKLASYTGEAVYEVGGQQQQMAML